MFYCCKLYDTLIHSIFRLLPDVHFHYSNLLFLKRRIWVPLPQLLVKCKMLVTAEKTWLQEKRQTTTFLFLTMLFFLLPRTYIVLPTIATRNNRLISSNILNVCVCLLNSIMQAEETEKLLNMIQILIHIIVAI